MVLRYIIGRLFPTNKDAPFERLGRFTFGSRLAQPSTKFKALF